MKKCKLKWNIFQTRDVRWYHNKILKLCCTCCVVPYFYSSIPLDLMAAMWLDSCVVNSDGDSKRQTQTADRWKTPFLDFLFHHHRMGSSKTAVAFLSSLMNYENIINLYSSPLLTAARRKCLSRTSPILSSNSLGNCSIRVCHVSHESGFRQICIMIMKDKQTARENLREKIILIMSLTFCCSFVCIFFGDN